MSILEQYTFLKMLLVPMDIGNEKLNNLSWSGGEGSFQKISFVQGYCQGQGHSNCQDTVKEFYKEEIFGQKKIYEPEPK